MTNKEKRMAAIEELKPLLTEVKRIRDKYGLACVEVRARHFNTETGNMSVIVADDERDNAEIGEVYGVSWYDYEDDSLNNDYTEWHRQADKEEEVE